MSALAVYRLPYGKFATMIQQTDGEPAELLSCAELNGRQGFVMAPFEITDSHPILLIRPDKVERISVERGMRKASRARALLPLSAFRFPLLILMPSILPISTPNWNWELFVRLFWHDVLRRNWLRVFCPWNSSTVPATFIPVCLSRWYVRRRAVVG